MRDGPGSPVVLQRELLRDHRFVEYPRFPRPWDLYRCRTCGYQVLAHEIQMARFNYPCASCNYHAGFIGYEPVVRDTVITE